MSKWNPLAPWKGVGELTREHYILFATLFANRMGNMAFPFLILFLTQKREFNPAQAGFILAIYGVVSLFAAYLSGILSDKISPVRILKFSLLSSAAIVAMYPYTKTYAGFICLTVLWSLAAECFRPANSTLLTRYATPQNRKIAFAVNRLAANLGMSMGPALGGFLAEISYETVFLSDAASTLIAASVLFLFPLRKAPESSSEIPKVGESPLHHGVGFRDTAFLLFLTGMLLRSMVFFQHDSTLALFVSETLKLPTRNYGFLFTMNTLLIVALEIPLNGWMAKWSHKRALMLGSVLITIAFGSLAWVTSYGALLFCMVIFTFGEMIQMPTASAAVADFAPKKRIGEYMGLMTMTYGLGFTLGPWLGALIYQSLGMKALWLSCFAVGGFSIFIFTRNFMPKDRMNS